uniref:Aminoglycoside phosphotransferase n=1 Tax=Solibacter usitatus (strain Ellin6076) TaxID=234267 RepID=Q021R5_SOLUE
MPAAARKTANGSRPGIEIVRRIIVQYLGSKPARIHRETAGRSNLVFSVDHDSGQFIVRINSNPAKLDPFLKEQWATRRARKAGIPVAEILEVGNDPVPHMILRKAAGKPATSHPKRMGVIRELGHFAAHINSIQTNGFGSTFDWSPKELSKNPDWLEFLRSEIKLDHRLRVLNRLRMVNNEKLETLRRLLENAGDKRRSPRLTHGDLRLKNVLVDEKGSISAILDWETCTSNLAPEWELALALHDLSIDEKQEFLFGYGLNTKVVAAMAPVVKALNIINYAPQIERFEKRQDTKHLEMYRLRLSGALELYSL